MALSSCIQRCLRQTGDLSDHRWARIRPRRAGLLLLPVWLQIIFAVSSHDRQISQISGSVRQKLAVQGRYKVNLFLCVLTGSLQGVAERPLPCSYNVILLVCALSRRKRGFKSRRGRQINNLQEKCLLSV